MSYGQAYKKATSPQPGGCSCLVLLIFSAIAAIAESKKIFEIILFIWMSLVPIQQWVVMVALAVMLVIFIIGILPQKDGV